MGFGMYSRMRVMTGFGSVVNAAKVQPAIGGGVGLRWCGVECDSRCAHCRSLSHHCRRRAPQTPGNGHHFGATHTIMGDKGDLHFNR